MWCSPTNFMLLPPSPAVDTSPLSLLSLVTHPHQQPKLTMTAFYNAKERDNKLITQKPQKIEVFQQLGSIFNGCACNLVSYLQHSRSILSGTSRMDLYFSKRLKNLHLSKKYHLCNLSTKLSVMLESWRGLCEEIHKGFVMLQSLYLSMLQFVQAPESPGP